MRSEKGRAPQRSEGPVALHWHEANDWLARRLQSLNAAGRDDIKLPAGVAGRGDGQIEIRMRWKFEPV